jgi:hypothetical protein
MSAGNVERLQGNSDEPPLDAETAAGSKKTPKEKRLTQRSPRPQKVRKSEGFLSFFALLYWDLCDRCVRHLPDRRSALLRLPQRLS